MDVFIARQPIFDKNTNVVAYELLYRNCEINRAQSAGDNATSSVIINGLLVIGLGTLTDNKKTFIKFTRNLLLDETVKLLPPDTVVVEVMEDFESDPQLVKALMNLKVSGYTIALDAYTEHDTFGEILTLADIVKVDFMNSDTDTVTRIAKCFRGTRIRLFAEKIETQDQFDLAKKLGYGYFQGYFFAKPNIVVSKDVQSIKGSHIRILKALSNPEPEFEEIANAIEGDLALSYKLLKLVNSGAHFGISRITSIRQSLVRLGMKEVSKWMALIIMRDAGGNKPEELVRASMIRARAMEELAAKVRLGGRKAEFFLLGVFSMMDAIMDRPMESILEELPLDVEIKSALLGERNLLRHGLEIITAYERADWDTLEQLGSLGTGMTDEMLFDSYFEAIRWTQSLYALQA